MKKRRLKGWVKELLVIINIISILFMGSDCEDLSLFTLSHLIALVIFIITSIILIEEKDLKELIGE